MGYERGLLFMRIAVSLALKAPTICSMLAASFFRDW